MSPQRAFESRFRREVDDLLLHLRGLVLVRELLEQRGASDGEIRAHTTEIGRLRDRLAAVISNGGNGSAALSLCH
jgi:hypothetical protein